MQKYSSPKESHIFGILLFSGAILLSSLFPARSQQADETFRSTETTIVAISPTTDSLRVATPNGTLNLWIASAKFVREESGLTLTDLKAGDTLSEISKDGFHLQMEKGALPLTSLQPFVLEHKAATDPIQVFPSTSLVAPSISAKSVRVESGHRLMRSVYEDAGVTLTVTKPDYVAKADSIKFGEPGDGVTLTILKPETMTFTRSTRIQFSDLAVGQIVSADITLEPNGRAVCHLLKVVRD